MRLGDFRKLDVWQKSQELAESIYQATCNFPTSERYGLCAQMRRAAVSVSANLAEGCGRTGDKELRRFIRISLGSLSELESECLLAGRLRYLEVHASERLLAAIHSVRGMLQGLYKRLDS
jgi:four helix bundle protein